MVMLKIGFGFCIFLVLVSKFGAAGPKNSKSTRRDLHFYKAASKSDKIWMVSCTFNVFSMVFVTVLYILKHPGNFSLVFLTFLYDSTATAPRPQPPRERQLGPGGRRTQQEPFARALRKKKFRGRSPVLQGGLTISGPHSWAGLPSVTRGVCYIV